MTVIDSCIIIDLANDDQYTQPALKAIKQQARKGRLFAPDIVFAEVCVTYKDIEEVRRLFSGFNIEIVHLDETSLHLAARSFCKHLQRKRESASSNTSFQKRIIADFYIGAFATHQGLSLLTRDTRRKWSREFPTLQVLNP